MKTNLNQFVSRIICLCFLAGFATNLHATTFTWGTTTTPSSWATQGNWSTGTLPTTTGDTADFSTLDITAATTVTLDGNQFINQAVFGDITTNTAFGWVVGAGTPSTSSLIFGGANPTLTVNALGGSSFVDLTAILAATNLTKSGSGTLRITPVGLVLNGLTISGGTVNTVSGANFGVGTLTFSGSGTFGAGTSTSYTPTFNAITNAPGATSTINVNAGRGQLGTTTAPCNIGGTLTINIGALVSAPARVYMAGTWQNNSGSPATLNLVGTAVNSYVSPTYNGSGANNSFNSQLTNVTFNLSSSSAGVNKIYVNPHNNSGGNTFNMGALSGTGDGILTSDNTGTGTTYSVGALGTSTTFGGQFLGNASLTKIGAGTLTLTNNSTIGANAANAVNVNGGKLVGVTGGSFLAPAFNVANGATNGVQVASTGGQWITTNLVYATGTNYLEFNFGTTAASTTVAPLQTTNLTINSVSNIISVVGGANWAVGTYPLIKYTGTFAGSGGFAVIGLGTLPLRVVATLNNNTANHTIDLVVSAVNEPLNWAVGNGNWDIAASSNWKDAASVSTTYQEQLGLGDQVVFDDSASGSSPVTVTNNTGVTPASVTFSNVTKDYVLAGVSNILGTTALTKTGAGKLTLQTTNSYSGGTYLSGGILNFSSLNNLGSGGINFTGGTLQFASGNTTDISTRTVWLGGAGTIDTAGNNVTLANRIGNSGPGSLTKAGAGTLTLGTNSTYTGATFINQGTLALGAGASLSNSPAIVVGAGATLDASAPGGLPLNGLIAQILAGSGTVTGAVTTVGGTKLSPATNGIVGTLTFKNDLNLNGGTFYFDVGTSSHDLMAVGGNLNLNGTVSGTMQINALNLLPVNSTNTLISYPPGQLTGGGVGTLSLAVSGVAQSGRLLSLDTSVDGQINLVVLAAPAHNLTWLGDFGANAWDNFSPNWTGVTNTYSDGDNANFTDLGSANSPVNISPSAVTPNSVTFNATNNYTLTGAKITGPATVTKSNTNTVTLANVANDYGATVINAGVLQIGDGSTGGTSIGQGAVTDNASLVFNQPDNSSVLGDIGGTGSLSKLGGGTLTLLGNNNYSGPTTVDTGVLQIGNGGVSGTLAAGAVTLSTGGTLDLNHSGTYSLANTISGDGILKFDGAATVTYGSGKSYLQNTYINNGIVKLAANDVIPSGGLTSGWLILDGGASSAGALDLNGYNQSVNALSGLSSTVLGQIYNNGSGLNTLTIGTPSSRTFAGLIKDNSNSGTGQIGLKVFGDGSLTTSLTLSGLNTFSGPVVIDGAKVVLGNNGTQQAIGTGPITLTNTAALQLAYYGSGNPSGGSYLANSILVPAGSTGSLYPMGRGNYSGAVTVHGTLNLYTSYTRSTPSGNWSASDGQINVILGSGGSQIYLNTSGNFSFGTAAVDMGSGTLLVNGANTFATGNTITIGELTGTGTVTDVADVTGGTDRVTTYAVGGRNSDATFSGTIRNNNRVTAVNKVGSGKWTLNGTDSYTGATTVSGGSLIVGSSSFMTASTLITVASGAVFDVSAYNGLTFSAGQTLAGSGVVTGAVALVDSDLLTPGGSGTAGTLSFSNSLTLGSGGGGYAVTNNFDLSSDPTGLVRTNDRVVVAGDLTLTGTNLVVINPLNTILGAGTYTLIKYSGTLTTNGVAAGPGTLENNFTAGGAFPANAHVSLTFSNTANKEVVMIVTPAGNSLVWLGGVFGTATNNWDLNLSTNWLAGATTTNFLTYDNVTFNDTATNFNAVVAGTLAPGAVTVNSTNAFTFSGTGKISGTTGITKSGTNVLTISNSGGNDYTGTVNVNAGTLKLGVATALGATNGNTVVNGGTLDINGAQPIAEPIVVQGSGVGGNGAIINNGAQLVNQGFTGNITLAGDATFGGSNRWDIYNGSLTGNGRNLSKVGPNYIVLNGLGDIGVSNILVQSGYFTLIGNTTLGLNTGKLLLDDNTRLDLYSTTVTNTKPVSMTNATISSSNLTNVYGGTIALTGTGAFTATTPLQLNGVISGSGSLLANGAGLLTLNNSETYTGATTISNGVLALTASASLASTNLDVAASGAVLDVSAKPSGLLTLASGQTLKGIGIVRGSITEAVGSAISPGESVGTLTVTNALSLAGNTVMEINKGGAQSSDRIACASVNYGGTLTLTNIGSALAVNDFFQLFSVTGSRSGAFTTIVGSPGPGLAWYTDNLPIDGTIAVIAAPSGPPTLTNSVSGSQLTLSWPAGYLLESQTNNTSQGLGNNWVTNSSAASPLIITVDPAKGAVFYRLIQQ